MIHVSLKTARKLYFEGFCLHPRQQVAREKAEGRGARPLPRDTKASSAATVSSSLLEARSGLHGPGESQHPAATGSGSGGLQLGEPCVESSGHDSSPLPGALPPLKLTPVGEPGLPGHTGSAFEALPAHTVTDSANSPEQTFFVDAFHFVSGEQRVEVNVV